MKTYLVTGGAGFVGGVLAKKLLLDGHDVYIIDNLSTGFKENIPSKATFIFGDCSKKETIDQLDNIYFDAIFHIAGQSSGEISFEDPLYDIDCNTISTLLLLQYAVRTNCPRVVYASTMSVYGDNEKQVVSELDIPNPKSFYAVGKLASENYLKIFNQVYGINYTILRYFNIYGPGQNMNNMKQGMASIFLKQLLSKDYSSVTIKGSIQRFRDFIFIEDLVKITIDALDCDLMKNQILNVGTGVKTTIAHLLDLLMQYSGIEKSLKIEGNTLGDQFGIYADNSKLRGCIDYHFTPIERGIELFVKSQM